MSLVFWNDSWRPESFYDKICKNRKAGLHTLCLLGGTHRHIHTNSHAHTVRPLLSCLCICEGEGAAVVHSGSPGSFVLETPLITNPDTYHTPGTNTNTHTHTAGVLDGQTDRQTCVM